MRTPDAVIFDIQRYSTHDGPGVRTTVFFKGCPLRCPWCSNPESQSAAPQLLYYGAQCTGCGSCVAACQAKAMRQNAQGQPQTDRALCTACGQCTALCRRRARSLAGTRHSLESLCTLVRQDWRIFSQSGGGITCGGGEALSQFPFLHAFLSRLHNDLGFHTCLDTTAYAPWEHLQALLPVTDLFLVDIKHMDNAAHKRVVKVDNTQILANIRQLAACGAHVIPRIPLIPAFNDDADHVKKLGDFLRQVGLKHVEIMPYHCFGQAKYAALDKKYDFNCQEQARVEETVFILNEYGVQCDVHTL